MATWTGRSFVLNQILTSTQMNQLQADITAQSEGASGAPKQANASFEHYNDYKLDHFGSGGLGAVTISSNTTLQPGAREYTNFTVNSGITLTKGSDYPGPLIIKCTGTLTIDGSIVAKNAFSNQDAGGSGGSGGCGLGASTSSADTNFTQVANGADGVSANTVGNNGNDAEVDGLEALFTTLGGLYYGGSSGSNGVDGTTGSAGAAGGGGGVIILIAKTIDFNASGTLDVSGDDGSNSTGNSGAGGGGGGGLIIMFYETLNTDSGTYNVSGGSGGINSTGPNGGDGGNGYTFKKDIAQ
jgi:hypothetical protein